MTETTTEALIAILRDHLPLTCGRNCEREMGRADEDLAYGDAAAAVLTLMQPGEEFLEYKEAPSDLRSLRQEHADLNGGGPNWTARNKAAWDRVDELYANEDEDAYMRQQSDAHG